MDFNGLNMGLKMGFNEKRLHFFSHHLRVAWPPYFENFQKYTFNHSM